MQEKTPYEYEFHKNARAFTFAALKPHKGCKVQQPVQFEILQPNKACNLEMTSRGIPKL